ncbi:conserved hypothetical protein [Peptoniphilus harei ACS-146-V-Sch2b]|uniref:Copper amine oxidase-like N-terminal domain-containing protein n=1 Tax=Peptoniphilus harei ACS-146-V-Sch2b TaxID=908338 RepID=E4KY97_9FIRM|nr:conserved hypothetical protein [Peptoniphilus harei ACS-146-V-Sch2b]
MKKKFLFILSFLLLFTSVYASERKKMTLVINNIVFKKDFVVKNDRIHIPLRLVSENLGADVIWKGDTRQVEIINKGKRLFSTLTLRSTGLMTWSLQLTRQLLS